MDVILKKRHSALLFGVFMWLSTQLYTLKFTSFLKKPDFFFLFVNIYYIFFLKKMC